MTHTQHIEASYLALANIMESNMSLPDMSYYWAPFTANRQFKAMPRLIKAAKGNYFTIIDNR